jgi:hypothetical protein
MCMIAGKHGLSRGVENDVDRDREYLLELDNRVRSMQTLIHECTDDIVRSELRASLKVLRTEQEIVQQENQGIDMPRLFMHLHLCNSD